MGNCFPPPQGHSCHGDGPKRVEAWMPARLANAEAPAGVRSIGATCGGNIVGLSLGVYIDNSFVMGG
jgi:hypothetical protein